MERGASVSDYDETVICDACAGSGEGYVDGSTCRTCRGGGEVLTAEARERDQEMADEAAITRWERDRREW